MFEATEGDLRNARTERRVKYALLGLTVILIVPVVTILAVLITKGGPMNATLFYMLLIYRNAFRYFRMGYAAALAWVLSLIILVFTMILLKVGATRVYYETEAGRLL